MSEQNHEYKEKIAERVKWETHALRKFTEKVLKRQF